ncbi:helix-turn-helix domain-containing protein [Streptomyces sp. NPDC039016]|uniref:MarR family transcriptional regulator n=1 Tax=Streptomyces sp. NPDC039016 TaxID=3154330 RepID=UPI0033F64A6F
MSDTNLDATTTRSDTPPGPLTGLTGAAATAYTQLMGVTEPVTVAELARTAGIGHSTAGRAVATLEKRGLAARTPGGHDGPRRMPDLWHPTIPASAPETKDGAEPDGTSAQSQPESSPDKSTEPTASAAEDGGTSIGENLSDTVTTPETDSTPCTIEPEPNTPHSDAADDAASPPTEVPEPEGTAPTAGPETGTHLSDTPQVPQNSGGDGDSGNETSPHDGDSANVPVPQDVSTLRAAPAVPAPSAGGRLAPGALRQMVIDHLQAHPDEAFTATRISRVIEKSSGAIANALTKLVGVGIAEQVTHQPRTFRLARHAQADTTP